MASNKAYVGVMTYFEQPTLHAIHTNNLRPLAGHNTVHECMFYFTRRNSRWKASSTYEDYVYGQTSQQASKATYQFLLAVEFSGGMLGMRVVL